MGFLLLGNKTHQGGEITLLSWQGRFALFEFCWDACGSLGRGLESRQQRKFCTFDCMKEWSRRGAVRALFRYLPRAGVESPQKGGFSSQRLYHSRSPSSPRPVLWRWGRLGCTPLIPSCCYSSARCCWCPGSAPPGCGHPCEAAPSQGPLQRAICGEPWGMETPKALLLL